MHIYLAGLSLSHLRSNSKYTQAAGIHGSILVSFFDYTDPTTHSARSFNILPEQTHHERHLDLSRDPLQDC
jgi:hypothetical protein